MKLINKQFDLDPSVLKSIAKSIDLADLFLIDIETTGFSSMKEQIYLIGCIYYTEEGFHFIQWLCEKAEDEYELLFRFAKFIQNFQYVLHYNGTQFDIPFIKRRMQLFQISSSLHTLLEIDVYTLIRPFQKYFKLENLKLKTVEKRYGYERTDHFTGGMLIETYKNYIATPTSDLEADLLLHNEEDLLGLYQSLHVGEVLSFLGTLPSLALSSQVINNQEEDSLQLRLEVQTPLDIQVEIESFSLSFTKTAVSITIPIIKASLFYYYKDFKDYYYLPSEDKVIHKSLATYVEKDHRVRATRENCHTKKRGIFIPLPKNFTTTLRNFKFHYKETTTYVELTDSLFEQNTFFKSIFESILSKL